MVALLTIITDEYNQNNSKNRLFEFLFIRNCEMMKMKISKEHTVLEMNKKNEPVLSVDSGSTVVFETMDCFSDTVKTSDDLISSVNFDVINPATGPLYINEAKVGDTLKVTTNKIDINNQGVVVTAPGLGQFGKEITKEETVICEIRDDSVIYKDMELPLRKMVGVIGTAPAGEGISTGSPDAHGGNLDSILNTEGSSIYFPVNTDGALLAMGDCHAAMGDGEVNGTGVEVAAEVSVTVEVIKDFEFKLPIIETETKWATLGSAQTMESATKLALDNMSDFIRKKTDLTFNQTSMLLSIAGDVKLNQIVNPNHTVRVEIDKDILNQ